MLNVNLSQFNIISLTETNLNPSINDAELGLSQYSIFRCDRSFKTSTKLSGGGVLVAVHKDIQASLIQFPSVEIEATCVALRLGHCSLIFCAVYIPPNQPVRIFQSLCDSLEQLHLQVGLGCDFFVVGDFNLNSASSTAVSSDLLFDTATSLGLQQCNNVFNDLQFQLDLVFSNLESNVSRSSDPFVHEDIHHPALEIDLNLPASTSTARSLFSPNYHKCNIDQLRTEIIDLNSSMVQSDAGNEEKFNRYINELSRLIKRNSPLKRVGRSPFPLWFSANLKSMVIEKKTLHRLYKSTGLDSDYLAFTRARDICKTLAVGCYNSYISHVDKSLCSNPKIFWSHIKNIRRSDPTPSRMTLGDSESSDTTQMCNLLARQFSSVYSDPLPYSASFSAFDNNISLSLIKCCTEDVKRKIDALDPLKGVGPDGIPPLILRQCSDLLCVPLSSLFNMSLREGFFPSALKSSFIVPIFKDGDRESASCYRPITIQSPVTKIFESVVLDSLKPLATSALIPEQHGFTGGRSTATNLILYHEFILSAFASFSQVDAVYLDFSKAFDKVSHTILISKLESYGILDPLLSWIKSYLSGRTSIVRFGGGVSDPFIVKSGVPQGSLLGPYLFNLFINDISRVIECKFLLFADDIKLFCKLETPEDSMVLQRSLDRVSQWCVENCMQLNASKCMAMSFYRSETRLQSDYTINNTRLTHVPVVRDLGVHLSHTLSPDCHIDIICSKASRVLGLLIRSARSGLSIHSITTLYKTLLLPIMEYASVIWKPFYLHHIIRLERLQRRFVRLVGTRLGMPFFEVPVEDLMTQLNLCPLATRRDLADLFFLFKLINGMLDCPDLLSMVNFRIPRSTRSTELFAHQHHRTNYLKFGTMARLHRLGNSVPPDVDFFCTSLRALKRQLS